MKPIHEKSAKALTVQEAVAQTIRATPTPDGRDTLPVKVVADVMRVPEWRAYQIADGTRKLWAEEVPGLVLSTGNPLVMHTLAKQAGGAFVPLPCGVTNLGDDYAHASDALSQFGQTMQAYASALSDGRVSREEAEQINREGHEAITSILALINHADTKASTTLTRKVER